MINLKFQFVGGSKIIEEEIRVSFGLQEFFTNVGGLLGLYLGCSVISVIEVFYFCFEFLFNKLSRNGNKVEAANAREEFSENQNLGLTLAEIFDLEKFFKFRICKYCE